MGDISAPFTFCRDSKKAEDVRGQRERGESGVGCSSQVSVWGCSDGSLPASKPGNNTNNNDN